MFGWPAYFYLKSSKTTNSKGKLDEDIYIFGYFFHIEFVSYFHHVLF